MLFGWLAQTTTDEFTEPSRPGMYTGSDDMVRGEHCGCIATPGHAVWDGLLCAIFGLPLWKSPALAELARARGPAAALLEAYRQWGDEVLVELGGGYALAVVDPSRRRVFLAVDRIGQRHLYYAPAADGLLFGTRADRIAQHPAVGDDIDPQAVFDYVYFHHCPSPGSIYRRVRKLEGGQCLVFEQGRVTLRRHWLPTFHACPEVRCETLAEELRESLFSAVNQLAGEHTGAFLSGGLDSSTIAGVLARCRPGDAPTFTIGFPVEGYDEIRYARIAAEHFHTRRHEYYLGPDDAVAAIPKIAAFYDEPFGNSSALPTYFCAKLAKEQGMTLLLGGDGGDELFGGNERYAKQLLFEPYRRVPLWLSGNLDGLLQRLPLAMAGRFPCNKLRRYIEQAKVALPDRLQDYNFLHRTAPEEVFAADFLTAVDAGLPLVAQRECYALPQGAGALDRMLYLDWKITLHDNDLVKVNRMCELAGIRVAYPMLDEAVVELACRVPPGWKIRHGRLRWFYKQAMLGFLPDAILEKSKHGFGLPFGFWLREHISLRELAYDSVTGLKQRPWFRPEFLDRAIAMHRSGHTAYYGELIWILMMLELWFEVHHV